MPEGPEGRFVSGSTMRHVTVMTLTGSVGLTLMFLVDFLTLLYVAMLGDVRATSALGYAWTIQFFTISVGIGFSIAGTALVSRALGARERAAARRLATSSLAVTAAALAVTAAGVIAVRVWVLELLGAEAETLEIAARFLLITLPSLPVMAFGMVGAAILRAQGDARRAMQVTLVAALGVAVLAPLMVFETVQGVPGLGWGVDGAAAIMVISRLATAGLALWYVVGVHDLAARLRWRAVARDLRPILAIALPGSATQLSTPLANFLLTAAIARHGDGAVAGWAVVSRMTVLAFGGIFALSGAIGGIVGQNRGAGRMDRVRTAYRDSLRFCAVYVAATWAVLWAASDLIARLFRLDADGAAVVERFAEVGAGGFVFAGALFVANAAFNNLGRPVWSTGFNWTRDAAVTPLMLLAFGWAGFGADGVIYAQAAAAVVMGSAAAWWGWRWVGRLAAEAAAPRGLAPGRAGG